MFIAVYIATVIFAILAGIYIYIKYACFNFWRKKGVVYMEPTVPMGNLGPNVHGKLSIGELFEQAYDKYKKNGFFGMYTLYVPNLVVADPDLIRFVLTKEFGSFHDRGTYCNEKVDPLSGHVFFLPGKKWRTLRVKLTPTFTSGKMKQMFGTLQETSKVLTKFLEDKAGEGSTVEIKDTFARFSTDVILSTAFGITCDSLQNPGCEFRYWGKKVFEPQPVWNALMAFAPQVLDILRIPFTPRGVTKFFTRVFAETVEYRHKNNVVKRDFLNLLMQLMDNGCLDADDDSEKPQDASTSADSPKFTMLEGCAQAYVFFLAGFETSSTTVSHCLYELAMNEKIQDKVRDEIDEVLKKHGGLSYNAVMDMPYLHKVVSETLRKYPSLPILNRICTKTIQLPNSDVCIPEGTLVVIPILGIHKDPDIYPDPDKFDPERFNEENTSRRHPYAYLPFGEGPRVCIGMRFGLLQTKVGIISSLSKFKFKPGPKTPKKISFDPGSFVLTPKDGVHLTIEHR